MATGYLGSGVYGRVYGTSTGVPGGTPVVRSYAFPKPGLQWVITHNLGSQKIIPAIFDLNNNVLYAGITVVTPNQFIVNFTEPTAGIINVTFVV